MSEKKVGKRLLTWLLVLVMTLSLLPLNVLAEEAVAAADGEEPKQTTEEVMSDADTTDEVDAEAEPDADVPSEGESDADTNDAVTLEGEEGVSVMQGPYKPGKSDKDAVVEILNDLDWKYIVTVKCSNSNHSKKEYKTFNTSNIREVTKGSQSSYKVTLSADSFVNKYNSSYSGHTSTEEDKTITLEYKYFNYIYGFGGYYTWAVANNDRTWDINVTCQSSGGETSNTHKATFYYAVSPTSNLDSNYSLNWAGFGEVGAGSVDISNFINDWTPSSEGATGLNGHAVENSKGVTPEDVTWPTGFGGETIASEGYVLKRDSGHWTDIFDAYKDEVAKANKITDLKKDDITSITLVPYKVSRYNVPDDYHVDCKVVILCKKVSTVTFWLKLPNGTQFDQFGRGQYCRVDDSVIFPGEDNFPSNTTFNEKITVGSKTYHFDGWYMNPACTGQTYANYTVSEANQDIKFYGYYVEDLPEQTFTVTYTDGVEGEEVFPDQTYTVKANDPTPGFQGEPTRKGYTFTGWDSEVAETVTKNVTYTATWAPKEYDYTVYYYEKGTTTSINDTKSAKAPFNTPITSESEKINIDGYEYDSASIDPLTIGTGTNEMILYYVKRTNYSYTVNYYWNGTSQPVENSSSKVVSNQTFKAEVEEAPATFPGWTPVSNDKQTLTIKANNNENVINFYYYKNVELTANNATETYNGTEQVVIPGYTCDVNGLTFEGVSTRGSGKNADKYPVTFENSPVGKVDTTSKYIVINANNGTLTITPREITLTSGDGKKVYDGTALTKKEVKVDGDGFASGEGASYDVTGSQTDVGSSDNTFTYTLNEGTDAKNYTITPEYGTLEVTPVTTEVVVTITGHTGGEMYNGKEQKVTGYDVSIDNDLYTENDFTFSGKDEVTATNAQDTPYRMGLKASDFKNISKNFTNVTFEVTDGSLTISKQEITLTSEGAKRIYNGNALTNDEVKITSGSFAEGEGIENYDVTGSQTDVGESDNEFTYTLKKGTLDSNYKIKTEFGKLKVTPVTDKVTVTITGKTKTEKYDGTEEIVTGYKVVSISNPLYKESDFTFSGKAEVKGTDANTYPMGLKTSDFTNASDNFDDVEFVVTDGSLTIEKRKVTLTSASDSKKYDGKALTNKNVTVSGDGFVKGEGASYDVTGSQTRVGSSDNTFTYELNANTKAQNYTIETKKGTLTVTSSGHRPSNPSEPTVTIEDDDALGLNTTDHFAYIVGYGNGEVRPQNNITRAEVATIFFRLLTDDVRDENLTKTNRYSDVAPTSWYNTAVSTLSSMGIITGYPDGTFRPNAAITRAEFAAIAARFDPNGDKTAAAFSDIASHWAKDEISIAYNNGWINGYPDGTFGPQRDITRAETMTLVNRVLNRLPETEDDLLPNMTVWTDNANPKAWYYLAVQEATNSHYYEFKTNSQYEKWTELRETRDWTQLEK